jgi:hypothetical protein
MTERRSTQVGIYPANTRIGSIYFQAKKRSILFTQQKIIKTENLLKFILGENCGAKCKKRVVVQNKLNLLLKIFF